MSRSRSLVLACLQRAGRDLLRDTSARLAGTVRQALADSMGPEQRAAMCARGPAPRNRSDTGHHRKKRNLTARAPPRLHRPALASEP
ncbi:hypothetical protein EASAB2608_05429 [Streptomyces sp. EAS-AB2608]|uniref:Transposase n=1 Tax=Streptomyces bangladeshensis TaxID=295352 RepID=A0ABP5NAH9_9ACTN|nr:hypothetical protein EASAB2608_05429 [Streptomyces sp. EAS-AB2608]CUW31694.1 hypothetical protein TUE45_06443 [Streptomyces reticuli]